MIAKTFLVSIIVIVSVVILYELTNTNTEVSIKNNKVISKNNVKNSTNEKNSCKKVRFNLDKNTIKLISPNNKKMKQQNQYNNYIKNNQNIQSENNTTMIEDKVEFNNTSYGNKIMDNSNFFNSTSHVLTNPQVEFVKKLNQQTEQNDNDIFKNQKGYWESQTIDDFVNRTYDNNQVANFNKFREENVTGETIAKTFDNLSEVNNRDLANTFGDSVLRHDDNSIMGNMDSKIYGYSTNCNQSVVN